MTLLDEVRFPLKDRKNLNIDRCARTLKEWAKGKTVIRKGKKVVIQLETVREGNRLVTSREAVKRFLAALNGIQLSQGVVR